MVTSPTGKGVIVMGGSTAPGEYSKVMFEFAQSMEWTRLEQTLQFGHKVPLAIPIPDELVYEKDHPSMKNYVVNEFVATPSFYLLMGGIFLNLLMWRFK